jgi:hypothetical protein
MLKVVQHIVASSAETMGDFNKKFETDKLHRPTVERGRPISGSGTDACRGTPRIRSSTPGLTLVRFSAQLQRVLWDRGCA